MSESKICSNCNIKKNIKQFSKSKRLGHQANCKVCASAYLKQYRIQNKEKLASKGANYRQLNKKHIADMKRKWQLNNTSHLTSYQKNYEQKRSQIDIIFKLRKRLRSHLSTALNSNYKSGSAIRDLGCTIAQLKVHLESKFKPGMTWDNWSRNGWHIDHKKPLSSFDLSDPKQLKSACHYTNLQPLWAEDNMRKGDKI